MEEKKGSFFESFLGEARSITKKIVAETGKTYQSFKINMDAVSLKRRRRERCADLGYKVYNLIKEGKLNVPGVEYIISELKALDFQIKLKEEDLVEIAAAEPTVTDVPKEKEETPVTAKPTPKKKDQKPPKAEPEMDTVKLPKEKTKAAPAPKTKAKAKSKAKTAGDPVKEISALKGIGEKLAKTFIDAGYDSVKKIAAADAEKLGQVLKRSAKTAQKYIDTAKDKSGK